MGKMKHWFLEKYFPKTKYSQLRKQIMEIQQFLQEFLYDYWMRYLELLARCPYLSVGEEFLIEYFHVGLSIHDRETIDSAINGSLLDLPPNEAWKLVENMTNNNQQHNTRENTRGVNEVYEASISSTQLDDMCNDPKFNIKKFSQGIYYLNKFCL